MDDERTLYLTKGQDKVMLYVAWYGAQRQGQELINAGHRVTPERHPVWRRTHEYPRVTPAGEVREALLSAGAHGRQRLAARYWNRINGQDVISPFRAKALLALDKLSDRPDAGAVVIIAAPYVDLPEEALPTLDRFTADMKPALDALLGEIARQP
jgi:EpsI family protein